MDLQASGLSRSLLSSKCPAQLGSGAADLPKPHEWGVQPGGVLLGPEGPQCGFLGCCGRQATL